jgi:hypothetical protein
MPIIWSVLLSTVMKEDKIQDFSELRVIMQHLILNVIVNQKRHIGLHMDPIRYGFWASSSWSVGDCVGVDIFM